MGDMQEKCDCRRPDITIFEVCRSCGNLVNFEDLRQQAVDTYDRDGQPIEDVTLPRRHLLMGNPRSSLRVLHLDNDASPILSGTFERASITHLPSYEAVSYCWGGDDGDYTKSEFIIIGGRLFPITKNCAAVLRKIRKTNSKRVIWVDSLCINQNDVKERSVQVSQMGQIFSGAQKVHIFLGNNVDKTTASKAFYVLNSMQNLNEFSMKLRNGAEPVKALFTQTYFSRMWIIQEVLLAKSAALHWGTATIPWQTLSRDHLEEFKKSGIDSCIPEWMRIRATTNNFRNSETLGELLFSAMGSTASNDRDKVYGIYGLLFDAEQEGLTVDYGLSVNQVFTNMAIHLIKKHNALPAVIRHVDHDAPPVDDEQLPSWVPDFRSRCIPKHTKMSFEGFKELDIHSSISSEEVVSSIGEKGLCLRGHRLRIVQSGCRELSTEELNQGIRAKFPVAFNYERDVVFWMSNGLTLHLKRHAAQEDTYTLLGECYLNRPAPLPTVIVRDRRKSFAESMVGLGLQDVACLWKVYKALEDFIRYGSLWDEDMHFGLLRAQMNMDEAIRAAKAYRDFCGGEVFNDASWELYSEQQQDAAIQAIFVLGDILKPKSKVAFYGLEGAFGWLAYKKAYNTKWWRDQRKYAIKRMVDFQNFWEDLGTWEKLHRFSTLLQHPESYDIQKINQLCEPWLGHYRKAEDLIRLLLRKTSRSRTLETEVLEELKAWEVTTKGLSKALQWTEGFFWPFKRPPSVHVWDNHEEKRTTPKVDNKNLFGMLRFWRDDKTENSRTEEVEEDSPNEQKGTPDWVIKNNFKSVRLRVKKFQARQEHREFEKLVPDPLEYALQPWRGGWVTGIGSISRLLAAKDQLNLQALFR
ncbi:uncharacterized protein NECHADRAFT_85980 [Fusarium vanettenii 77-13-4]|uniref:Heterokaryon incompatibility domain-containing protein n=1 Tax=Fusarium vanettenii (strain ATCC MYA-4622 / CBS 123669 / FGSC 9596 / NRRL 45880 / 77-13-4) TaxID=660122 RepID=C7Z206_FUSV7|nr:uncharacterized protein NECHADRAFT_85980 [Fusarium vanettenii 77-13-4]EEU41917.1 hypothetical protein NECHADRAFT_85980 [Fusarium vanettenii 77-13-4]